MRIAVVSCAQQTGSSQTRRRGARRAPAGPAPAAVVPHSGRTPCAPARTVHLPLAWHVTLLLLTVAPLLASVEPVDPTTVRLTGGPLAASQAVHGRYLLSLEVDRLVSRFRAEAGLPVKAPAYPGWESVELPGVAAGFYLSGCSRLWAATGDARYLDRVKQVLDELEACQRANGDGFLSATRGGKRLFGEIARGDIRHTGGWMLNGQPEPYYALEKLLSGLRDAWRVSRQPKALAIERALADWLERNIAGLDDAALQRLMACEFGGLNWVLADLYADTGEPRYLAQSRRWQHRAILEPLSRGVDMLPGNHANTQFPKISGLAARYLAAGDPVDRATAEFFWDRVAHHHSYVTGSNSLAEHFGAPDQLSGRLAPNCGENCNCWNMLRLSGLLFQIQPRAEIMDYVERVLYNHILAAQHPADGRVCYFLSLEPGGHKVYEPLYDRFACCTCSAFDSYARHSEWLYARDATTLYVNLYAPSRLTEPDGLSVEQTTDYPEGDSVTLKLSCRQPLARRIALRCPGWLSSGFELTLNGQRLPLTALPGSYAVVDRTWRSGDRLELRLPRALRAEPTPDDANRVAFCRGALVLAADLGPLDRDATVPTLPADDRPAEAHIEPGDRLAGAPLVPFYRLHDRRYTVYFERLTAEQQAERQRLAAAARARLAALDARTVDRVVMGDAASEAAHDLRAERSSTGAGAYGQHMTSRWRDAQGWFSYRLKLPAGQPLQLLATYWGRELGNRTFDVLVDDQIVGTTTLDSNHPAEFYDVTYPLPAGREQVTVTFRARPGNTAGGLFDLRVVKP